MRFSVFVAVALFAGVALAAREYRAVLPSRVPRAPPTDSQHCHTEWDWALRRELVVRRHVALIMVVAVVTVNLPAR